MNAPTEEEQTRILRAHVASLMEHFDAVQIFATKREKSETMMRAEGSGNWYARRGMVATWQRREDRDDEMDEEAYRKQEEEG